MDGSEGQLQQTGITLIACCTEEKEFYSLTDDLCHVRFGLISKMSARPHKVETCRDVVAMEMGPHVAPANKNVAPGAKQLLIINISNYTVL